ncbi:putative synaptobrevin [Hamiltosporidium magnivora]|uniref:Putative synaptobrevin n=1 Tax=Hamiltosporidium magnivora TaxID=148818 RepID=A0A4Q9L5A7_9MICR|nr:putative synaptobrevin [Hamiltosporidium magnivora]
MILALLSVETTSNKIKREAYDLSSFNYFTRKCVREMIQLTAITLTKKIQNKSFQKIIQEITNGKTITFYIKVYEDLMYVMCVKEEYPEHIALIFLNEASLETKDYKILMAEYQDYKSKDVLMSVNTQLEETKYILSDTLESVIGREEMLDDLVKNAENLSQQTKQLFLLSRKQNRCFCSFS